MKKGFTLTETLVVVAIIILVAGVAFPAFSRARDAAYEPTCLSNMRQIYVAASLYREDNGEWPGIRPDSEEMTPYTKGAKFRCKEADVEFEGMATRIDYMITGNPNVVDPLGDSRIRSKFLDCREKRGPMFPIVIDKNHGGYKREVERGLSFWFIGRADGSIQRVIDADRIIDGLKKVDLPCGRELQASNL